MKRRQALNAITLGTILANLNPAAIAAVLAKGRKRQVVDLLKSFETGDTAAAAIINPRRYTQHNLSVADGFAGFQALVKQLPPKSGKVDTVRVFEDGEYVFAHTLYDFSEPTVGFDIFRFEDGLIVEHWDNLQTKSGQPNPAGRTMIDGAVDASDLDKTEANKALVKSFVEEVLGQGRLDRVAAYIDPTTYIQHNPRVGDGADAMVAAFHKLNASATPHRYHKVHKVLGEGSFVLTASEGLVGDTPTAYFDLFRVANGRIVEHWDALQTIPPRAEWKNTNGKF